MSLTYLWCLSKFQVSKQGKARVKNLSAAYSRYVCAKFFRVTPFVTKCRKQAGRKAAARKIDF